MKKTVAFLAALAVFASFADGYTWSALGSLWYYPMDYAAADNYGWQVRDTSGEMHSLEYDADGNCLNGEEVIESIKSSVKTVFKDMVKLSESTAKNTMSVERLDASFETLSENLDSEMAKIYAMMGEISFKDETSGETQTYTTQPAKDHITLVGPVAVPDEKSVTKDSSGKLSIYGFSGASDYYLPSCYNGKLVWSEPYMFADGATIGQASDSPLFGFKNWDSPESGDALCSDELGDMLTGANGKSGSGHFVLTKFGDKLHYTKIGSVSGTSANPDGSSIVTNGQDHAGQTAIAGFWTAAAGTSPVKSDDGLVWVPTNAPSPSVDGKTVELDGDSKLAIVGTSSATDGNVLIFSDGKSKWGNLALSTNSIAAGAGITLTAGGTGTIVISADEHETETTTALPGSFQVQVVTGVSYDSSTHQLVVSKRTLTLYGVDGSDHDEVVFTATPHADEHSGDSN